MTFPQPGDAYKHLIGESDKTVQYWQARCVELEALVMEMKLPPGRCWCATIIYSLGDHSPLCLKAQKLILGVNPNAVQTP